MISQQSVQIKFINFLKIFRIIFLKRQNCNFRLSRSIIELEPCLALSSGRNVFIPSEVLSKKEKYANDSEPVWWNNIFLVPTPLGNLIKICTLNLKILGKSFVDMVGFCLDCIESS